MKRWWPREVLRFVDAWACREGTPEDDEDGRERRNKPHEEDVGAGNGGDAFFPATSGNSRNEMFTAGVSPKSDRLSHEIRAAGSDDAGHDWIELDTYPQADEEIGRKGR